MVGNGDAVDVGDVYTNIELDLTYRVVDVRDEGNDMVVTVETLDEGVETYRTADELVSMLDSGEVVESDVPSDAFGADEDAEAVPVESSDDRGYLRIAGAVVAALALAGVFIPAAAVVLKFAARFLVPVGIAVLAAYLLYRALS
jgi:hypothetical protein